MNKGGLIVAKKEMTKMWIDNNFVPVTLVQLIPQEIVRYKTQEKDGYVSAVIGVEKKELKKDKGQKIKFKKTQEYRVDDAFVSTHQAGAMLDVTLLEGVTQVDVTGEAKGKGFQGMVKKFHIKGGGATHGHKFSRTGGSKGNRKPRRTLKGHPHAGHMGTQQVTLKDIAILDKIIKDNETLVVLKGSIPGAYNSLITLTIK
ncbi:MAG: 50S ribosomal protein L3 [Candidatus Absconditabacterales bacterium]